MNLFWKLRILTFYAIIAIYTVLSFLISIIPLKLFNNYNVKYGFAYLFSHGFVWITKMICGIKYEIRGLEKLPSRPSIAMANHQSFWDNVFMQVIIPKHSWIIKRELFDIPFFGWGLKAVDPIAVDRSDAISVKQILTQGVAKLKQGLWIVIFPESTRLRPEQKAKFKPSAAKLAALAGVPIVLVAHNAGVYWPKGFWITKPGTIEVVIVGTIEEEEIAKSDVRELTDKIENLINEEKERLFQKTKNL